MKVAVMMPAFNAATFIGDALASLLRQRDAAQLDIIVVDDGSTDATAAIVEAVAATAPEVRLLRGTHTGVSAARNLAIAALAPDTDLVTWLDADDLWAPGRLAAAIEGFRGGSLDMLIGTTRLFYETGDDPLQPVLDERSAAVRAAQLANVVLALPILRQVGMFDEALSQGEDLDFLLRTLELQPRYAVTDDVVVYYRRHGANMTLDSATLRRGIAQAMLKVGQRRRQGAPPVPAGVFESSQMWGRTEW